MNHVNERTTVRQGLWFHGGVTPSHVRIERQHTLPGSHDADDPPEIAHDREVECYCIRYELPHSLTVWHDGGCTLSLREALFMTQRRLGPVVFWDE